MMNNPILDRKKVAPPTGMDNLTKDFIGWEEKCRHSQTKAWTQDENKKRAPISDH